MESRPFRSFCGVSCLGYNSDLHFRNYLFICTKKIKKIVGGLLEVGCIISVVALIMTLGAEKTQHPTFEEVLATSYGYESVQCKGVGDVRDGDTPCVAYSNHGRKRQVITVVGDSEKNTVRVYDSNGNLVKPVLTKAPSKKD